ncbi:hypothetical protein O181_074655 [Austropuccinia psidii MF-1]|uniref:Uncharacterized protein n=1 Tax=Austropuccinia psidii MF-1 TaxID=1389203 RepID=A0A9Q3ID77_9BASI|nr:hypothetical protein [Austropuccinia psidii MF-1]
MQSSKRKSDSETGSKPPSSRASKPASKGPDKASGDEAAAGKKPRFVKEDPNMTAKQFADSAKGIHVWIGESGSLCKLLAEPTTFSTGSFGWKTSGKTRVKVVVDGEEKEVGVQIGVNLTVSGSKPDQKATNGKRGRPRKQPTED